MEKIQKYIYRIKGLINFKKFISVLHTVSERFLII